MQDPNGKHQHEPGAKLDLGKPMIGTVLLGFSEALIEVSKVGTFGANKYTIDGWKSVPDGERRYTDAMMRHLLSSEEYDSESGQLHAAMVAWNALARLHFIINKNERKKDL